MAINNNNIILRKLSSERAKGYYQLNDEEPTYSARYLGKTKVVEFLRPENGLSVSARCVDKLYDAVQRKAKKRKVSLLISSNAFRGITVTDLGPGVKEDVCYKLFDIAYCCTDLRNKMIFSFIVEREGELECHAFVFKTEEMAKAVCLALSNAFTTAHEEWMRKRKR